jgi:nanoRNase/pAp phosphatase (c-di-AMP/oligoRNAs hydrolase)
VDAAFGVFEFNANRCLVIGRSLTESIDVGAIMRHMGGGGHPGAGSAILKSADPIVVEAWIRVMIGKNSRAFPHNLMDF